MHHQVAAQHPPGPALPIPIKPTPQQAGQDPLSPSRSSWCSSPSSSTSSSPPSSASSSTAASASVSDHDRIIPRSPISSEEQISTLIPSDMDQPQSASYDGKPDPNQSSQTDIENIRPPWIASNAATARPELIRSPSSDFSSGATSLSTNSASGHDLNSSSSHAHYYNAPSPSLWPSPGPRISFIGPVRPGDRPAPKPFAPPLRATRNRTRSTGALAGSITTGGQRSLSTTPFSTAPFSLGGLGLHGSDAAPSSSPTKTSTGDYTQQDKLDGVVRAEPPSLRPTPRESGRGGAGSSTAPRTALKAQARGRSKRPQTAPADNAAPAFGGSGGSGLQQSFRNFMQNAKQSLRRRSSSVASDADHHSHLTLEEVEPTDEDGDGRSRDASASQDWTAGAGPSRGIPPSPGSEIQELLNDDHEDLAYDEGGNAFRGQSWAIRNDAGRSRQSGPRDNVESDDNSAAEMEEELAPIDGGEQGREEEGLSPRFASSSHERRRSSAADYSAEHDFTNSPRRSSHAPSHASTSSSTSSSSAFLRYGGSGAAIATFVDPSSAALAAAGAQAQGHSGRWYDEQHSCSRRPSSSATTMSDLDIVCPTPPHALPPPPRPFYKGTLLLVRDNVVLDEDDPDGGEGEGEGEGEGGVGQKTEGGAGEETEDPAVSGGAFPNPPAGVDVADAEASSSPSDQPVEGAERHAEERVGDEVTARDRDSEDDSGLPKPSFETAKDEIVESMEEHTPAQDLISEGDSPVIPAQPASPAAPKSKSKRRPATAPEGAVKAFAADALIRNHMQAMAEEEAGAGEDVSGSLPHPTPSTTKEARSKLTPLSIPRLAVSGSSETQLTVGGGGGSTTASGAGAVHHHGSSPQTVLESVEEHAEEGLPTVLWSGRAWAETGPSSATTTTSGGAGSTTKRILSLGRHGSASSSSSAAAGWDDGSHAGIKEKARIKTISSFVRRLFSARSSYDAGVGTVDAVLGKGGVAHLEEKEEEDDVVSAFRGPSVAGGEEESERRGRRASRSPAKKSKAAGFGSTVVQGRRSLAGAHQRSASTSQQKGDAAEQQPTIIRIVSRGRSSSRPRPGSSQGYGHGYPSAAHDDAAPTPPLPPMFSPILLPSSSSSAAVASPLSTSFGPESPSSLFRVRTIESVVSPGAESKGARCETPTSILSPSLGPSPVPGSGPGSANWRTRVDSTETTRRGGDSLVRRDTPWEDVDAFRRMQAENRRLEQVRRSSGGGGGGGGRGQSGKVRRPATMERGQGAAAALAGQGRTPPPPPAFGAGLAANAAVAKALHGRQTDSAASKGAAGTEASTPHAHAASESAQASAEGAASTATTSSTKLGKSRRPRTMEGRVEGNGAQMTWSSKAAAEERWGGQGGGETGAEFFL
ncbi:hypothetical protein V8E36_008661 [Tilletia maclaganii]